MSEELLKLGYSKHGRMVGNYEFYNIGATTLNQLVRFKIIPKKAYKYYASRKPDALLVDRRNLKNPRVICVIENKESESFKTLDDKTGAVQQCNDLCQVLSAEIGIATDTSSFIWFNPNHPSLENEYKDKSIGTKRSYTIIKDESGNELTNEFIIDQKLDEVVLTKLTLKTAETLKTIEVVRKSLSSTNSQLSKEVVIDPTKLAKQIWQDLWSATGATPEPCLYNFLEIFIFKYLSDLNILIEDDKGSKINFEDVYSLGAEKAFKYYSQNVRPYLRVMFPQSEEDGTTIINGTILNPSVKEHSEIFYNILNRFKKFGPMRSIDPNFKSKVFSEFMKETISRKNWGQFFTPRNIIDAMIEISGISELPEGSLICDPACGVGGFILEPMKVHPLGPEFFYQIQGNSIKSRYMFRGYDKGFEKEQQLVTILAKANMLIFLSELLKTNPTISKEFSNLFNDTFKLLSKTILGTLALIEPDKYDLILTNPPYVTSGSAHYKKAVKDDASYSQFYKINAMGVEGLFLEWIIRCLKPSRKAFVIIPDGLLNRLNDNKLRQFIKDECVIDGIISLPVDAFYRNQKKTYIIALTKKPQSSENERKKYLQTEPVFTYLVSEIGETRDVNRFPMDDNDLNEMVPLFNQFKGAKTAFKTEKKRCKIQPIEKFDSNEMWSVDRWWNQEEKIELKIASEQVLMTIDEFKERVQEIELELHELNEELAKL